MRPSFLLYFSRALGHEAWESLQRCFDFALGIDVLAFGGIAATILVFGIQEIRVRGSNRRAAELAEEIQSLKLTAGVLHEELAEVRDNNLEERFDSTQFADVRDCLEQLIDYCQGLEIDESGRTKLGTLLHRALALMRMMGPTMGD
jgi:hypothetical protein